LERATIESDRVPFHAIIQREPWISVPGVEFKGTANIEEVAGRIYDFLSML
jgi:hypothetical protein